MIYSLSLVVQEAMTRQLCQSLSGCIDSSCWVVWNHAPTQPI